MFLYGLENSSVSLPCCARITRNTEKLIRFTQLVYMPEGRPIMDALWEETIAEFEFAGVREILKMTK